MISLQKSLKPEGKVEKDHLASTGSWPGLLWTSQHDLYYNRDEVSILPSMLRQNIKSQTILKIFVKRCSLFDTISL